MKTKIEELNSYIDMIVAVQKSNERTKELTCNEDYDLSATDFFEHCIDTVEAYGKIKKEIEEK